MKATRFSALHEHFFLSRCDVCFNLDVRMETNSRRVSCSERKIFKVSIASDTSSQLSSTLVAQAEFRLLPLFPRLRGHCANHFGVLSVSCFLRDTFIGCGQELFLLWRHQLRMQWCTSCRFILVSIALCIVGWTSFAIEFGGLVL